MTATAEARPLARIRERHLSEPGTPTSTLAAQAAQRAIDVVGLDPECEPPSSAMKGA